MTENLGTDIKSRYVKLISLAIKLAIKVTALKDKIILLDKLPKNSLVKR